MTKISILHEEVESPKQNPIKFVYTWNEQMTKRMTPNCAPKDYQNVVLIAKGFTFADDTSYDLIFAYDEVKSSGALYLGYWNDGVV